jgi:hypothetical protein
MLTFAFRLRNSPQLQTPFLSVDPNITWSLPKRRILHRNTTLLRGRFASPGAQVSAQQVPDESLHNARMRSFFQRYLQSAVFCW